MTLFRQIAALVSIVLLLILAGVVFNDIHHSRQSLQGQMQTMARDMATTLGVAIANSPDSADPAVLETLFNAVFDSGYLSSIALYDPVGNLIHEKSQPDEVGGVPRWFVEWVNIDVPKGEAVVSKGWVQVGNLKIVLHPGYAYAGLYRELKSNLLWLALIAVSGLVMLWWVLHWLLRPLRKVRQQADAIYENRFLHQEELPSTHELRRVVEAMNRMVSKVKQVLSEQSQTLKQYHELLYQDQTTGLPNRRAFIARLHDIEADEAATGGFLVVVHLEGGERLAETHGYEPVAQMLTGLAAVARGLVESNSNEIAARLTKFEFALYLSRDQEAVDKCVVELLDAIGQQLRDTFDDSAVYVCAGMAQFSPAIAVGELLSRADFALSRARAIGGGSLVYERGDERDLPAGRLRWRQFLEQAMEADRLALMSQSVQTAEGDGVHEEVYVRLRGDHGELMPAGLFMPMATDLHLDHEIDLCVIQNLLPHLSNNKTTMAVNLGAAFLSDVGALARLETLVSGFPAPIRPRILFESRHFLLYQNPEGAEVLFGRLRPLVGGLGIDNLDLSLPLDQLQNLRPAYVKASAKILADMVDNTGSSALGGLTTLANSLDIRLIAIGVETPALKQTMLSLGMHALQGNEIASARELTNP